MMMCCMGNMSEIATAKRPRDDIFYRRDKIDVILSEAKDLLCPPEVE